MLPLKLSHDYPAGALRSWRVLSLAAQSLRLRVFKGASPSTLGAVVGWGAVVVLGAALMTSARHESASAAHVAAPLVVLTPVPVAPAPVVAQAKPAAPAPAPVATPAPAPAPAPAPVKVTQRVDMTPTASIVEAPKAHKKPHKKKTKDLDTAN